ncbi:FtsK/SpoIIIE domain-containing protein [Priestia aryabhattai]|uniref:FtsK/SpoIIIE domain-containing protein n=1 Tax=Priestia aryabhattai TaxID=412384 RepID=UPI0015F47248|nr:FtsK/SpoIIIE domain-containing protein [Priestia aryabhattai]
MLLNVIKNKINKTPIENNFNIIQEVDHFDLTKILASPYLGEGVYGIEQLSTANEQQRFVITPSLDRIQLGRESAKQWFWESEDKKNLSCYNITLALPSFLPLYTQEVLSIIDDINLIATDQVNIFTQFLFTKRMDDWRENAIYQYDSYLDGNDYPSDSRIVRKVQNKTLNVLSKIDGSKKRREHIPQVEDKLLDHWFRFEFRVMFIDYSNKEGNTVMDELKEILKEANYFNHFEISSIDSKPRFLCNIKERKMSPISQDQLLSEQELLSIFNENAGLKERKEEVKEIVNYTPPKPTEHLSLSTPINLLFNKEMVKYDLERHYGKEIINALKKVNIITDQKVSVKKEERGATVQKVLLPIPKGVKYTQIETNLKNIQAALGVEGISVEQGEESDTVSFLIPCEKRDVVYLRSLLEDEEFIEFAKENKLPFVVGIDMNNKPIFKCLTKAPHLLVAGSTGSGKSVYLNAMIIAMILFNSPNELLLYLIDPKVVELSMFEGIPHVQEIITDMRKANQLLYSLTVEMDKRYQEFAKSGCRNIESYNKKSASKMPYIVLVIDELADLMSTNSEVEEHIERIGQKARACGIHMVICTQRPEVKVVTGLIKANIPTRISFSLQSTTDYRTVFDKNIPYRLLGRGDGCIRSDGQSKEFIRFQSPTVSLPSDEDEEAVFDRMRDYYKSQPKLEYPIIVKEETEIEKLKRIISTTEELRVKELAKEMKTRVANVGELLKELEEEGFLTKTGNTREITASEEELKKWRKSR